MIIKVRNEEVRVNSYTIIKWVSDGRIFHGRIWDAIYPDFFDRGIIVFPFKWDSAVEKGQYVRLNNIIDVDPWIKPGPKRSPTHITWEEWKANGN